MFQTSCVAAAFVVVMFALRYLFTEAIDRGGHLAFVAIIVAIFAIGFWWERRHPTNAAPDSDR